MNASFARWFIFKKLLTWKLQVKLLLPHINHAIYRSLRLFPKNLLMVIHLCALSLKSSLFTLPSHFFPHFQFFCLFIYLLVRSSVNVIRLRYNSVPHHLYSISTTLASSSSLYPSPNRSPLSPLYQQQYLLSIHSSILSMFINKYQSSDMYVNRGDKGWQSFANDFLQTSDMQNQFIESSKIFYQAKKYLSFFFFSCCQKRKRTRRESIPGAFLTGINWPSRTYEIAWHSFQFWKL